MNIKLIEIYRADIPFRQVSGSAALYQLRVQLNREHPDKLLHRARGRAKVYVASRSLFARLGRWLRATFSATW